MRAFADQAPAEIYASLLDEGVYHCSIRTMYRILGQHGEVRERREQLRHPAYRSPNLSPNCPTRSGPGTSRNLWDQRSGATLSALILDIFSRRVVGW